MVLDMAEHDPTPPPGLTQLTTYLASKAGLLGRRLAADAMAPTGVHVGHYGVLACLAAHGPASQRDIGGRLGLDASDVVTLLDDMEAVGLVERRRDPDDRRRHAVTLTEAGVEAFAEGRAAALAAEDEFLSALSPDRRAEFGEDLLAILAAHDDRYGAVCPEDAPADARTRTR
jgi:DNA-binding MarR family transcriptional regulator